MPSKLNDLLFIVVLLVFIALLLVRLDRNEVSVDKYHTISNSLDEYPVLRDDIANAFDDGFISHFEARSIMSKYNTLVEEDRAKVVDKLKERVGVDINE